MSRETIQTITQLTGKGVNQKEFIRRINSNFSELYAKSSPSSIEEIMENKNASFGKISLVYENDVLIQTIEVIGEITITTDYTYNNDGNLTNLTATDGISSWEQNLTYTNGVVSEVSEWGKIS